MVFLVALSIKLPLPKILMHLCYIYFCQSYSWNLQTTVEILLNHDQKRKETTSDSFGLILNAINPRWILNIIGAIKFKKFLKNLNLCFWNAKLTKLIFIHFKARNILSPKSYSFKKSSLKHL